MEKTYLNTIAIELAVATNMSFEQAKALLVQVATDQIFRIDTSSGTSFKTMIQKLVVTETSIDE